MTDSKDIGEKLDGLEPLLKEAYEKLNAIEYTLPKLSWLFLNLRASLAREHIAIAALEKIEDAEWAKRNNVECGAKRCPLCVSAETAHEALKKISEMK